MKKISALALILLCCFGVCRAQNSCEVVRKDPAKAAGSFYVYDYKAPHACTPAPAGYKPFYVSHFGRHGARYCTSEYETLYNWFSAARKARLLTEEGGKLYSRYDAFYQKANYCKGNLTSIGKDQHRSIATTIYNHYPEVFDGQTHIEAVSTESPRVIMSMWSFISALQALDSSIDINADASGKYAPWLQFALRTNPYLIPGRPRCSKEAEKAVKEYSARTVPWNDIARRFFTHPEELKDVLEITPEQFLSELYSVVACSGCLDEDRDIFDDVFSEEERFLIWKAQSAQYFLGVARFEGSGSLFPDFTAFTVENIIDMAEEDIASGSTQLRLRFGHDANVAPLLAFLDVNGFGRSASSFEESLDIFPSYELPMGCSLQLVFFRNADNDILLKALLNEEEAELPLKAVQGPYYRWEDFKAYYKPRIAASKERIEDARKAFKASEKPSVQPREKSIDALKAVDWGWKKVSGSAVEEGHAAKVKVFNSVQDISLVRFRMRDHAVSIHESDGPSANTVSKLGADCKALAAINGGFFDKSRYPISLVKDDGKVVSSKVKSLSNEGLFLIKNKKGSKVDIVTADSLAMMGKAKGWYEAMAAGPVLIEDGTCLQLDEVRKKLSTRRHPRTVVGYTSDGYVYFVVVDGRFPLRADGMTLTELQILCEALGLYEAINLDGGGSATMWTADAGVINHPCDNKEYDHAGERVVPNILIVK